MNIREHLLTYINKIFKECDLTKNDYGSRIDEIDNYLKNIGWSDAETGCFFSIETNSVVFYYLLKTFHKQFLFKDKKRSHSNKHKPIIVPTGATADVLTIFYACLFLTYSYTLPEISYPMSCFYSTNGTGVTKKRLIQATVELCNFGSKGLLKLNSDISFYERIRDELLNKRDGPLPT
jgi:hypothetical protein